MRSNRVGSSMGAVHGRRRIVGLGGRARLTAAVLSALVVGGLCQAAASAASSGEPNPEVLWWKTWDPTGQWANFDGNPGDEVLLVNQGGDPGASEVRVERRDGSLLWRYPPTSEQDLPKLSVRAAGDFDGDGAPDVATLGGGELLTLSGRHGTALHRASASGSLAASDQDLDGDGRADILLRTGTKSVSAFSGADLSKLWNVQTEAYIWWTAVRDADGDGAAEVAFASGSTCGGEIGSGTGKVQLLDGKTGIVRWSADLPPDTLPRGVAIGRGTVVVKGSFPPPGNCGRRVSVPAPPPLPPPIPPRDPPPLLRQFTVTTGAPHGTMQQLLIAYQATDGAVAWRTVIPGPASFEDQGLVIGDLGGDGTEEVVASAQQLESETTHWSTANPLIDLGGLNGWFDSPTHHPDAVYSFDLATGVPRWVHKSEPRTMGARLALVPRSGGRADVAYATLSDVVLLSGRSGDVLWTRRFSDRLGDLHQEIWIVVNVLPSPVPVGESTLGFPTRDRLVGAIRVVQSVSSQDLDGDGEAEVAVEGVTGWRTGLSPTDGSPVWQLSPQAGWTAAVAGPGSGHPDVIVGDKGGGVSGLAAGGTRLWTTVLESNVSALAYDSGHVLAVTDQPLDTFRASQVTSLDARTGEILWRTSTGNVSLWGPAMHRFADVDGDGVTDAVVGGGDDDQSGLTASMNTPSVTAISGRTGEALWERTFPLVQEDGKLYEAFGTGLTFSDGVVVATMYSVDGESDPTPGQFRYTNTYGLDAKTGESRWSRTLETPSFGGTVLADGGVALLQPLSGDVDAYGFATRFGVGISAISPADGTELWSREVWGEVHGPALLVTSSPQGVFVLDKDSTATARTFRATIVDGEGTVTSVADDALPAALAATVTEDGGLLYAGTGGVVELSIDALFEGKTLVRRRFRLPARSRSTQLPTAEIDYPLVERLVPFGSEQDHVLGFGMYAAWVAQLK